MIRVDDRGFSVGWISNPSFSAARDAAKAKTQANDQNEGGGLEAHPTKSHRSDINVALARGVAILYSPADCILAFESGESRV